LQAAGVPPLPGRNPSPWQCVQEVFASAIVSDRFQFLSNLNVLPGLPFNPNDGKPMKLLSNVKRITISSTFLFIIFYFGLAARGDTSLEPIGLYGKYLIK
jgi:hypothetical protein